MAIEKPKLDSARKLRGIYFIGPKDEELKETLKKKKTHEECWKFRMAAAMPCKIRRRKHGETCSSSGIRKTKYACIVEADESTRKRLEGTPREDHEDHIAGKGINSLSHCNLVHKFCSYASSNEDTGSNSSSGKIMEKNSRKYQRGN